jgi:hypothetical protein
MGWGSFIKILDSAVSFPLNHHSERRKADIGIRDKASTSVLIEKLG